MKHKTWFRLVIKVIGIFLIATGGASLLDSMFTALGETLILRRFAASGFGLSASFEDVLSFMLSAGLIEGIARIAIGAYLLLGGVKLINFCIPNNRPYCPDCGYDVREVGNEKCPECGVRLPAELLEQIQQQAEAELKAVDD